MAQPQPSIPDYPYPDGVPDERRNASTPARTADDDGGVTTLLHDPVSQHSMLGQQLSEAFRSFPDRLCGLCEGLTSAQAQLMPYRPVVISKVKRCANVWVKASRPSAQSSDRGPNRPHF